VSETTGILPWAGNLSFHVPENSSVPMGNATDDSTIGIM
jgi:hypothetical protein